MELSSGALFEVVFRGTDVEEPLQMNDMGPSTSTDTSDLEAVSLSAGKLHQLSPSTSTEMTDTSQSHILHHDEDSPLRETRSDPFRKPRWWRETSSLSVIIASMIIFCVSITIAMIIQVLVGAPQIIPHAGVLSNNVRCSEIGAKVLSESAASSYPTASTVDAAILTSLCLAIKNPHLGGLGGGGFMLIEKQHDADHDTVQIDFREMSPVGTDNILNQPRNKVQSAESIAIPGFLRGLKLAHEKLGRASWNAIFTLATEMANKEMNVTEQFAAAIDGLNLTSADIPDDLKKFVTKNGNMKTKLVVNDTFTQPELAKTLKMIGEDPDSFYVGKLADDLVKKLSSLGRNITKEDMKGYQAIFSEALRVTYHNMTVVSVGPPSSGPVLLSALRLMEDLRHDNSTNENLMYHRMLESLKYSYGQQLQWENTDSVNSSLQSSPLYKVNDTRSYNIGHYLNGTQPLLLNQGGQQYVTAIGYDGLVVSIVWGIGTPFGSKIMSSGYLLNNAILDFSWTGKNPQDTPSLLPSQVNQIGASKRPISAMVPALVLPFGTKCGQYMAFASDDGTAAISSLMQTILRRGLGHSINSSISDPRLNQEMIPYLVQAEATTPNDLISYLESLGHKVTRLPSQQYLGVANAITYDEQLVDAYLDPRDPENRASTF